MNFNSLKHGEVYLVANDVGDIDPAVAGCGLFRQDTRFISTYRMKIGGVAPIFLFKSQEAGIANLYKLSNASLQLGDRDYEQMELEIDRRQLVYDGAFYDHIRISSVTYREMKFTVSFELEADFADIFEVRGARRKERGKTFPAVVREDGIDYRYEGLDGVIRVLSVYCSGASRITEDKVEFDLSLSPGESCEIEICFRPSAEAAAEPASYCRARERAGVDVDNWLAGATKITTSNPSWNQTLSQAALDLYALATDFGHGELPVAGVPWFSVPFGRDSVIAALQTLMFRPQLAKNTLRTLAAVQGVRDNAWNDESPGKIVHEMRFGEMANLDEIPFRRYYGSIDSTCLFLILLSETYRWTGDLKLVEELLPSAEKALAYLLERADVDGDGFIEFDTRSKQGLVVQSWKDSKFSLVHRDGRLSNSPLAVVEVQGYLYDALRRMAEIYGLLDKRDRAEKVRKQAASLKKQFNRQFWLEDEDYFALALDRDKQPVATRTSDPGHCLWSGIIDVDKRGKVADALMAPDLFSGWGIRTMSSSEPVYNPFSYHNGSVWPHDNSLTALGLAQYGFTRQLHVLVSALFAAATCFDQHRLPELFCGYDRKERPLVPYPVACSPQAWAAGTPFACIQALLGLRVDAVGRKVELRPTLPDEVDWIRVENMRVGNGRLDLLIEKVNEEVLVRLLQNDSQWTVLPEE